MKQQMNFQPCPCNKSDALLKNDITDLCMKCGRMNIGNNAGIDDPIEYWKNLPQTYKDLTVLAGNGDKYVPYFIQQVGKIVYLDFNDLNQNFEYVVTKMNGLKIDLENAKRFPFMEFNKVLLAISEV